MEWYVGAEWNADGVVGARIFQSKSHHWRDQSVFKERCYLDKGGPGSAIFKSGREVGSAATKILSVSGA